ncbi:MULTISPECIES: hypothetical protein [Moorena]|uniref:hypothetical protein n=1 Tax=Moorena TaxID=1155738 RepID=UPI00030490CD|nr:MULTISPECIES: hypothetical protein [Moorena]NEQ14793.1 hypothetical protein [Moorena sp. SIO3E2]NEP30068.1 hypothetical protein [Moorena sp. SIO3B2]NEP65523.1 hypothetical protein [Moorena sp. SIO3A5]NEQ04670.1 hypothetical protein [Moorena sp. SIO4E2]NER85608.1 hypothetical protein [Moorena sp. SIO3A2]
MQVNFSCRLVGCRFSKKQSTYPTPNPKGQQPDNLQPSTRQPSTFNQTTFNLQPDNLQPSTRQPSTFNQTTFKPRQPSSLNRLCLI